MTLENDGLPEGVVRKIPPVEQMMTDRTILKIVQATWNIKKETFELRRWWRDQPYKVKEEFRNQYKLGTLRRFVRVFLNNETEKENKDNGSENPLD